MEFATSDSAYITQMAQSGDNVLLGGYMIRSGQVYAVLVHINPNKSVDWSWQLGDSIPDEVQRLRPSSSGNSYFVCMESQKAG